MLNTFRYVALSLLRNKGLLIWALGFPIVLSCCFMMMFQGLDDEGQIEAVRTIVVEDAAYEDAEALPQFIDAVGDGEGAPLAVTRVGSASEAEDMLRASEGADDAYAGYVTADAEGLPEVHLLTASRGVSASMDDVNESILVTMMDTFTERYRMIEGIAESDPAALADPLIQESLYGTGGVTEKIDVTENAPKESVRYYFALLGMACMFGAQAGLIAVTSLLPSTSALGARRALGGMSHLRSLSACIAASWVVSFACMLVAFAFIVVVAGVDFGGRDLPCLGVLAASSLMATALGALLGSLPKIPLGSKAGILTGLTCFATLFAGLYGQPTMELADSVAAACPASQLVNPAVQISQALFSLMYYDTMQPCLEHIGVILVMTAVFFAIAARFLRRQRYASL